MSPSSKLCANWHKKPCSPPENYLSTSYGTKRGPINTTICVLLLLLLYSLRVKLLQRTKQQESVSIPGFQALTVQTAHNTHNANNYAALTTPDVKPLTDCVLCARRPPTMNPRFVRDAPFPLRNRCTPRVGLTRVTPPAVLLAARHPRWVRTAAAELSLGTTASLGNRRSSLPADIAMPVHSPL